MSRVAFDSSAVITFLRQDVPTWRIVEALLAQERTEPVLLGPALTEIIHVTRRGNSATADEIWTALQALGFTTIHPDDQDLLRAADLKVLSDAHPGPVNSRTGQPATLSLADALILAMAKRRDLPVLTRDGHWPWMVANGLINVRIQAF